MATGKTSAVAYYRTSSATNVGDDKDSLPRQKDAVRRYAKAHRLQVVREFYDAVVSGDDPVDSRDGVTEMLTYLASNGARTVLTETAGRFARDLIVQLVGHDMLKARGISLIPVDSPSYFQEETPTAVLVRQILGAVSQFQKNMLVQQLRKARERIRAKTGKCEGRKSHQERRPETVALARKLRYANRRMREKRSLRELSAALAERGHISTSGKPYSASAIASMLAT
jgi:DNA invertase Pin-like site-specific DNA recombinase